MTAISLWQPWATLWLLSDPDEKVFETRGWYTGYRGDLIVHAAKKRDGEVREALRDEYFIDRLAVHGLTPDGLPFGALIGRLRLAGCCQMCHMPAPTKHESRMGDWSPERYAWERGARPVRYQNPIAFRGAQGFFEVPSSVLAEAV